MTDERRQEIFREASIVTKAIRRCEKQAEEDNRPVEAINLLELRHGITTMIGAIASPIRS